MIQKIRSSQEIEKQSYDFKWGRKFLHLIFSIFGFALLFYSQHSETIIIILGILTLLMIFIDTLRLALPCVNHFFYHQLSFFFIQRDFSRYSSGSFFMLGSTIVSLCYSPNIAGMGIIFLGIGDLAASYGGVRFYKWIPYHLPKSHKSYVGILFFVICTVPIGLAGGFAFSVLLIASTITALCEVYITFIDDNLVVPLIGSTILRMLL